MWNDIDSVVRALGRTVVWAVAAVDVSTIRISSQLINVPSADVPKTAVPRTDSTSFWWAGLPRPTPWVPIPA